LIDKIITNDLVRNTEIIKDFSTNIINTEINFKLSMTVIDSIFTYKKNKSLKLETFILDKKEELETLNNCISHVDATLGKYILNNSKNPNLNEYNISPIRKPNNNDSHQLDIILNNNNNNLNFNYNSNTKFLSDDFHYTEKVENYVLKLTGKELFKWDSILFFFNKMLLLLSFFAWIYKFDFFTVNYFII